MQSTISTLIICILTSIITILGYHAFVSNQQAQVSADNYSYAVSNNDLNLGGNLREHFYSAKPNDFISSAKSSIPAVVSISTTSGNKPKKGGTPNTSGSGVMISSNGHIVTNLHVIEGGNKIKVMDNDGTEYVAKIIGSDKSTDIAVLKIEKTNAPYLIFGNSDSIQVGEWVLAVGNPFKLNSTVTAGIVSAKGRDIDFLSRQGIESFIQTDAAINPGNSGGALVNTSQELIGINTAILSSSGKYEGFSFAIPSNIVQKITNDILTYGAVQRGWIGLNIQDINPTVQDRLNLTNCNGVVVHLVEKESAAADAGLRKEDVITHIENIDILSTATFNEQIAVRRPGDKVIIHYIRDGETQQSTVTLRNQLNSTDFIAVRKDAEFAELGMEVRDLDQIEEARLGRHGVYVVSISHGTKIANTNMEPGYIIETFNGNQITSVDQLLSQLKSADGNVFLEGFYEKYPGQFPYAFAM